MEILSAGFIYSLAGRQTEQCHASTIAESVDGLVVAWFGGTKEKAPDVGIWVSRHDGERWSKPEEVANGVVSPEERHPCWNPVLFQPANGPLMLFYKVGPNPQSWWGMLTTSEDGGRTWSKPWRMGESKLGHLVGPTKNKPIQLPDGAIFCGAGLQVTRTTGCRIHFEQTRDFGKTWDIIGPINDGKEFNSVQPTFLTYADGRIQILCRGREKITTQSWSEDGGRTWSPMTKSSLPNPDSGIHAESLSDGRQLVVYNHSGGRSPLNIALSEDGENWTPSLVLEDEQGGEFSYPAVIQTSDGLVHVTYTWKRQTVKHVVLKL